MEIINEVTSVKRYFILLAPSLLLAVLVISTVIVLQNGIAGWTAMRDRVIAATRTNVFILAAFHGNNVQIKPNGGPCHFAGENQPPVCALGSFIMNNSSSYRPQQDWPWANNGGDF